MNSPLSPQPDDSGSGKRLLLLLGGLFLLAYGAYTIHEARRGSWAHLISFGVAVMVYLGIPFAQRRIEAAHPEVERSPASRPRLLHELLWGLGVVLVIGLVFVLIDA
jgi:4-hydroxybenzoate polyprenyltransferase